MWIPWVVSVSGEPWQSPRVVKTPRINGILILMLSWRLGCSSFTVVFMSRVSFYLWLEDAKVQKYPGLAGQRGPARWWVSPGVWHTARAWVTKHPENSMKSIKQTPTRKYFCYTIVKTTTRRGGEGGEENVCFDTGQQIYKLSRSTRLNAIYSPAQ